jgi:hypothetical protein
VFDERIDHPGRSAPRGVGGADCLHYILKDGWAAYHSSGSLDDPREIGVIGGYGIERAQIEVEAQDMPDLRHHRVRDFRVEILVYHRHSPVTGTRLGNGDRSWPVAVQRHGDFEPPRLLIDLHGW